MSFTKTYFLCPTSEFFPPPPTGPLLLGSIIRSTSTPQYSLNKGTVFDILEHNPPVIENDWKKTVSAETSLGLGVYAQFLQLAVAGLGPEVDVEHSKGSANSFAFERMTTLSFEPTSQYVEQAVKAPAVQAWLKEPKQRFSPMASLFLVTGIKLVKGAKINYSTSGSTTVTGNLGVNVAPIGMAIGPKGHWSSSSSDQTEFSRDSEFVFAYRVKRLRFGRKLKIEEYNKGAFLATGNEERDDMCVLVEEVDGSHIESARVVFDGAENCKVNCIPA